MNGWMIGGALVGASVLGCAIGSDTGTFGGAASVGNDDEATESAATAGSNTNSGTADDSADSATSLDPDDSGSPPPGTEVCNGFDDDDDGQVDEDQPMETCGVGPCEVTMSLCIDGAPQQCTPLMGGPEICNGLDDDCNGLPDDGVAQQPCSTACGDGVITCVAGVEQPCNAPPPEPEICNLDDDNCNGTIDEAVGGCRVSVHRAIDSSTGEHFYSTDFDEAQCCGRTIETANYYDLYAGPQPGLVAFRHCLTAAGRHFYSQSPTCEGTTIVSVLGYIATSAGVAGSDPLYRLYRASNGDHLYTTSAVERDNAIMNLSYVSEGTAGYVW